MAGAAAGLIYDRMTAEKNSEKNAEKKSQPDAVESDGAPPADVNKEPQINKQTLQNR